MANSFPGSGLAYADSFSVGTANSANSSLYVCSSCVQATRIEHTYSQTNLHHNTLWLRANNAGARAGASIGFTVVNNGGDHHRANIEATANSGQIGGNLALYTRNNNGNDQLGIYIDNAGNVGVGTESPNVKLNVAGNLTLSGGTRCILLDGGSLYIDTENVSGRNILLQIHGCQKVAIGTNSPLANVRTDVRSTSSLTSAVGQPMFLGSNDTTGPLGVVIQHICGNGVCRVDFTSTRYGISGNDLSLNVDSSDPNTGGGLYVKYRGNVGISTSSPCTKLSIKCSTGGIKVDLLSLTTTDGAGSQPTLRFDTVEANCNVLGRISVCDIAPYAGTMIFETSGCKGAGSATTTEVMRLVGTTGNIGMGTTSPSYRLDIAGTSGATASMRIAAIYCGGGLGLVHLTSSGTEGGTITYEKTSGTAQKYKMGLAGDNCFFIYNETAGNQPFTLTPTGRVGISTTAPSYQLHVNGTFYAAGSSKDYKHEISKYDTDSCMFMKLIPVTYQYKSEWKHLGKELKSETQIGLIAEDVAEVYPELAILVNEEDEKVVRNVDYEKLSIILLSELQKLRAEVDELKSK